MHPKIPLTLPPKHAPNSTTLTTAKCFLTGLSNHHPSPGLRQQLPIRAPAPGLSPPTQVPEGSFRNLSQPMPLLCSKPSRGSPFHSKSKFFNGTRSCIINSSPRPLSALASSIPATDAVPVGLCTGWSPACLAPPPHTPLANSHRGVWHPPRASTAPSVCLWKLPA